jgi:hypothetical protein
MEADGGIGCLLVLLASLDLSLRALVKPHLKACQKSILEKRRVDGKDESMPEVFNSIPVVKLPYFHIRENWVVVKTAKAGL